MLGDWQEKLFLCCSLQHVHVGGEYQAGPHTGKPRVLLVLLWDSLISVPVLAS